MIQDPGLMLLSLIGCHFLADFAFQSEYMATAKNILLARPETPWWFVMFGHCAIHGMFVGLITGHWSLGLLELVCHFSVDLKKCLGRISFLQDQLSHLLFKVFLFWMAIHMSLPAGL